MSRTGSGPEFHVNLGRVGSIHLWVGLGLVKKIGPTYNSGSKVEFKKQCFGAVGGCTDIN